MLPMQGAMAIVPLPNQNGGQIAIPVTPHIHTTYRMYWTGRGIPLEYLKSACYNAVVD